ncbi:MAG: biopolymer transporter ExbD [Gemmatimonadetes bacterium]|nr:biopolymer transporter ExbD [Gemmatimonadota bacterium]
MKADINVTSLVDVAFTLLVIFIITMPILQGGVEVAVPRADVQAITSADRPFFVTIERDGTIYMAETQVSREDFVSSFSQLLRAGDTEIVYVRGDSLAVYADVLAVIATVAQTEGVRLGLIAEPWTGR